MSRLPAPVRALVLALFAFAPLVAASVDVRLGDVHTAAAEGVALRSEPVARPDATFAVGSAGMQAAIGVARAHWGGDPCGGQIALSWAPADAEINATSAWTNPESAYDHPQLNGDCKVTFNPNAEFDWDKFCTVMVHEYGHLAGRPHAGDPTDVMAAYYTRPLPACQAATPAELRPAPVATASVRSTSPVRQTTNAAKSKPAAKRKSTKRKAKGSRAKKRTSRKHRAKRTTRRK
jgi:Matrixin